MKMNKLVFPLVLVLAGVMATTGCKKGFTKVTPLPGQRAAQIGDINNGGGTLPPAGTLGGDGGAGSIGLNTKPGGGDTAGLDEFEGMIKDPAALAAYTVHFKFDSATVQNSEQANIASVAQALVSDVNTKLLIEGNCDERGTEEYNRSLGERRALAVREELIRLGIDATRVDTTSFGKDKPEDPGHDEAAWKKNRRDDFVVLTPPAK